MTRELDVIVAGELYVDMIMSGFEFWPQPGREAFAKEYRREIGGGASITACGLAKIGSRAAVLGLVGGDFADWIADRLKHCGVDVSLLHMDAVEATGFTVVATTPEDRAFLTYAGANRAFPEALMEAASSKQLSIARHVHLGFAPDIETAETLFDRIHECGCTISLDVGWHPEWLQDPRALAALKKVDLFFPNEIEAHAMTGEEQPGKALRKFADTGIERVALKLGSRGAMLLSQGELWTVATHKVTAVDTTGAGDCFDAGFLHAWLKGEQPGMCLLTANMCGAISTEGYGGISAFPTPERLHHELSKGSSCTKRP
jgi:sugar/nucleoside kinase (ribokinase family)